MKETVVLFMCGSFNPVTNMHLRMMEIARDHLHHCGHIVKGGFVSPVHDSYPKDTLISIRHRTTMLKLALESSNWLHISTWESEQKSWTETFYVLQHHQEKIHELMMKTKNINRLEKTDVEPNVTVKLVCGADFLASFLIPNLWKPEHIELILKRYGIVVITRTEYNVADIIEEHDILYKFMNQDASNNQNGAILVVIASHEIAKNYHYNHICTDRSILDTSDSMYFGNLITYDEENKNAPESEQTVAFNVSRIVVVNEHIGNAISSTKIRKACYRNRSIKYLVPDKVEQYIKTHGLYTNSKKDTQSLEKNSTNLITDLSVTSLMTTEKLAPSKKKLPNSVPRKKVKSKDIASNSNRPRKNCKRKSK